MAYLKRLSSITLHKSTNTGVTSSVAQAVDIHTHTSHMPYDTVKVKGGVAGKRKSFPASPNDNSYKKANNSNGTLNNSNPYCIHGVKHT